MKFSLRTALYFLLYLLAFSFCAKAFREPDLWWQLKTGEWIVQQLDVPRTDVFSYTQAGAEWINVKWLFEVLAYAFTQLFGSDAVYLITGFCWLLLIWVLLQIAQLLLSDMKLSETWKAVVATIGGSLVLYASAFRINGRPEVFSHLFTAVFIWLLLQYRVQPSQRIWWLLPLQILWTNLHEGFATGIVITMLFAASAAVEFYLRKSPLRKKQLTTLLLIVALLPFSIIIHPCGFQMISRPAELFSQIASNKYTSELFGISSVAFWKTEAYLLMVLLIVVAAGWAVRVFSKQKNAAPFPLLALVPVTIALLYLGTTAYRNLPFAALGIFPFIVFVLGENLQRLPAKVAAKAGTVVAVILCFRLLAGYGMVVCNLHYENQQSRDRFGLQISSELNPVGAANYITQQQLHGKCFSDYLVSAYLLHHLKNDFKTYVDLRDLDVFSAGFMDSFFVAASVPQRFAELHRQQQFDYAVLYRAEFAALHNYLYHDTNWRILFADAVAVVYAPREKAANFPSSLFQEESAATISPVSAVVNKLLNPFHTTENRISKEVAEAVYALTVNEPLHALSLAAKNFHHNREQWYDVSGQAWLQLYNTTPSDSLRAVALLNMTDAYNAGVKEFPKNVSLRIGKGAAYFKQGNLQQALEEFEQSTQLDKENLRAYLFAAESYSQLARRNTADQERYLQPALKNYKAVYSLNSTDALVKSNIGFISFRLKDCATATEFLQMIAEDTSIPEADRAKAKECIAQCR